MALFHSVQVVSSAEVLAQLKEKETKKRAAEKKKEELKQKKLEKELQTRKRKVQSESETEEEEYTESSEYEEDCISLQSDDDKDLQQTGKEQDADAEEEEEGYDVEEEDEGKAKLQHKNNSCIIGKAYLTIFSFLDEFKTTKKCWLRLNPPNKEEDLIGKWVGCIFSGRKTDNFFIGKITRRFLNDSEAESGYTVALEVDCLQQKLGITDDILREHDTPNKDVGPVPIRDVIIGPLTGNYKDNRKWEFPNYAGHKSYFEKIKKINRDVMYNSFLCSSKIA